MREVGKLGANFVGRERELMCPGRALRHRVMTVTHSNPHI
jgi:hypothetical protein